MKKLAYHQPSAAGENVQWQPYRSHLGGSLMAGWPRPLAETLWPLQLSEAHVAIILGWLARQKRSKYASSKAHAKAVEAKLMSAHLARRNGIIGSFVKVMYPSDNLSIFSILRKVIVYSGYKSLWRRDIIGCVFSDMQLSSKRQWRRLFSNKHKWLTALAWLACLKYLICRSTVSYHCLSGMAQ